MRDYFRRDKKVHFTFPIDGDCVNANDGKIVNGKLIITAKVKAESGANIYINGQKAEYVNGEYQAQIEITSRKNTLTAVDKISGESDTILVFNIKNAEKKFRLTVDDNILFLQDLTKNKDKYTSLFDNEYLQMYRQIHLETGMCVHLNLFYENDFTTDSEEYFNLSMMTDKYKDEWLKNASWLTLSFHAYRENPGEPYKNSGFDEVDRDCKLVDNEILRFAGREVLSNTTTLHFGSATVEGVKALRSNGYKALGGYFEFLTNGDTLVSYHYPKDLVAYVGERDMWVDTEEDVLYFRIDRVLNLSPSVEENLQIVKDVVKSATRGGFVELMIHEQYFYKTYGAYIKDFGEIIKTCAKYLKEQGYASVRLQDIAFEE